jgi:hypothetical protein
VDFRHSGHTNNKCRPPQNPQISYVTYSALVTK